MKASDLAVRALDVLVRFHRMNDIDAILDALSQLTSMRPSASPWPRCEARRA